MMRRLVALASATLALVAAPPALAEDSKFDRFLGDLFSAEFKLNPVDATDYGDHRFDAELGDYSPAGHDAKQAMYHKDLDLLRAFDRNGLTVEQKDDLEFLTSVVEGRLLNEERIQRWKTNPDEYLGVATDSVFSLIKRSFAPLPDRMKSAIARERQIPAMLTTAEEILVNPAKIYVQIAQKQVDGNIDFFRTDLPAAFKSVSDPALQDAFKQTNAAVIAALDGYKTFLAKSLPHASAPFALGPELFQSLLRDREMVDLPVDRILEVGLSQLHKDQAALKEAAAQIDRHKTLQAVIAEIGLDHAPADKLLAKAQQQLDSLRQYVIDHKLVTVVGTAQPKAVETPPFMRAITFASMDTPGPLETTANEAYYNITLPDPGWSAAKKEEYLRGYNDPLLQNVSVHEVWPGHFVQYLFHLANPQQSLVRKLLWAASTGEGWAHYSEQMMLDEGLSGGAPKYRLTQLQDALLRDCRLIVGIRMHTKGMSIEDGKAFFVKEGYQQPVVGEMEALRGTEDPLYLVYTLGKLGILKLRADYQAKMGDKFSLQDFHDRFNRAGQIPLSLIRREMMGQDGPLL